MTISDRLKEAKHGPVRQQIEEVFAVMGGSRAWQDQNRNHADLIDSLFEKHAKLIEEAHSRITAAARATRENDEALDKKISDLADRLSVVHVQAQGDAKVRAKQETAYGTAQPIMHWPDLEGVDANRMRPSVIDDCLKQGEKRIRLDEIDRIYRHIRGIYSSLHVSSYVREVVAIFDGYVEQRRREIEEGT